MTVKKQSISIEHLALEELVSIKYTVDKQIALKQKEQKKDILKKMNVLAKEAGFSSVADVVDGSSSRKPRADKGVKLPPKYRNPDDPNKTWSGKGRAPQWILAYDKKRGKKRDDLLI